MSTGVAIAGTGITKHGFFADRSWRDLVVEAAYQAMDEAGVDPDQVDGGMLSVTLPDTFEQQNLGALAASELALPSVPFGQIVGACAGGTLAVQAGVNMIASGRHRYVLIVGVEKVSDATATADTMISYVDAGLEAAAGFDYVDSMALMHQRYGARYGAAEEQIAHMVVQDRWYASRNPVAFEAGRPELTVEQVLASGYVSKPITRAACGKACDGAAAVLLTLADAKVLDTSQVPVTIAGISQATGPNALAAKYGFPGYGDAGITQAVPTRIAAEAAYREAGIGPDQIDLAQVHDCFSVMGSIHLEGLGIFGEGKAAAAIAAGETAPEGRCPTNTDGGRIGLGHPTGATGVSVVVESARQLRGQAGERQVPDPTYAACQSMGGNNATSAVAVLKKGR